MDPEPLPRLLLVAGVTYLTVGSVTLAIGIVFLVMESHETVMATWLVAVTDGGCAMLAGGLLSSFACNQRSQRTPSFAHLVFFTCVGGLALGSQVALLVLSSFQVTKDETWREIHIFMFASAGIQLLVLVISALVVIWLAYDFSHFCCSIRKRPLDSQDNYGFLGDNDTWRSSIKEARSPGLMRWPAVEHLESRGSSASSTGGHYIAGDHHPKFIGPSSGDSDESGSVRTGRIYADVHGDMPVVSSINHRKMDETVTVESEGFTQNQRVSHKKTLVHSSQLDVCSLSSHRRQTESTNSEFQKISSHKNSPVVSHFPQRPPRKCDSFTGKTSSLRRTSRPPVPTPRSISASPTLVNPDYPFPSQSLNRPSSRQLFLYNPVELEIPSVQQKRELMQSFFQDPMCRDRWALCDGNEPDGPRSVFNSSFNGGPERGIRNGGSKFSWTNRDLEIRNTNNYSRPIITYDHSIPRTVARRSKISIQRPNQPPPPVPRSSSYKRPQSPLFTVGNWGKGDRPQLEPSNNAQRNTGIKPQRKVTFLEAQV